MIMAELLPLKAYLFHLILICKNTLLQKIQNLWCGNEVAIMWPVHINQASQCFFLSPRKVTDIKEGLSFKQNSSLKH